MSQGPAACADPGCTFTQTIPRGRPKFARDGSHEDEEVKPPSKRPILGRIKWIIVNTLT